METTEVCNTYAGNKCPKDTNFRAIFTNLRNYYTTQPPTTSTGDMIFASTQQLDAGIYYDFDGSEYAMSVYPNLGTFVTNVAVGTVTRSVGTVDTNVELTIAATWPTRYIDGTRFRIAMPKEQAELNGVTPAFKYGVAGTPKTFDAVDGSSNSTHILLDLTEDQVAAAPSTPLGTENSGDNAAVSIILTAGFKNGRVVQNSPSTYYILSSRDSTNTYEIDKSTANIVATPNLAVGQVTIHTVVRESNKVAAVGYVDFELEFISTHLSTDYVDLIFDAEFFVKHTSDTVACSIAGGAAIAGCAATYDATKLTSIRVPMTFCGTCASGTRHTIRVTNLMNRLDS